MEYVRLAQLVERKTFNLVVVGSSPTVDIVWYSQIPGRKSIFRYRLNIPYSLDG